MAQSQTPREAAAYMSGVIESLAQHERVEQGTIENVNEQLRKADLEHLQIET